MSSHRTGHPDSELPTSLEDRLADVFWRDPRARAERLAGLIAEHPEFESALTARITELEGLEAGDSTNFSTVPGQSPSAAEAPAGQRVGPYRILEVLGEGAFGVVYRSEQLAPVRRTVALKVLKSHDPKVLARFRQELDALAAMEHENVARVLDSGDWDMRPFLALELVENARTLTEFCSDRDLALNDRIRLFQRVCDGVQHAHQRGVIHRDLKPGNVLVSDTADGGIPKIIDFGVARAMNPGGLIAATITREGTPLGTPAYMSPEQARGSRDIDARTDVYSLGVMLFELVAGRRPFDDRFATAGSDAEIAEIVQHASPPRPSTVAARESTTPGDPEKQRRTPATADLPKELDWIILRAMNKDREARYDSPRDLALDLQRHLDDEPVLAGPPSAAYRLGKFIRRHRLEVTAAVIVSAALLIATAVTLVYAVRADRQAKRTEEVSEQILELLEEALFEVHDSIATQIGSVVVRERIADVANRYLALLQSPETNSPRLARALEGWQLRLSQIHALLGDPAEATELFRQVERTAELAAADRSNRGARERLAEALRGLLRTRLVPYSPEIARAHSRRILAHAETCFEASPDDELTGELLALARVILASVTVQGDDKEPARQLAKQAHAWSLDGEPSEPGDADRRDEVRIAALQILTSAHAGTARHREAFAAVDELIGLCRSRRESKPESFARRQDLTEALLLGGETRTAFGFDPAADELAKESDALSAHLVVDDPGSVRTNELRTRAHLLRARLDFSAGRLHDSIESYLAAAAVREQFVRAEPNRDGSRLGLAQIWYDIGKAWLRLGDIESALEATQRSERWILDANSLVARGETEPRLLVAVHLTMCEAHLQAGAPHEADRVLQMALARAEDADMQLGVGSLSRVAAVHRQLGRMDQALEALDAARAKAATYRAAAPESAAAAGDLTIVLGEEARTLLQVDRRAEALAKLREAVAIREQTCEEYPDDLRSSRSLCILFHGLASLQIQDGRPSDARSLLDRSLAIAERLVEREPNLTWTLEVLGDALSLSSRLASMEGELDLALELATRCAEMRERNAEIETNPVEAAAAGAVAHRAVAMLRSELSGPESATADYRRALAAVTALPEACFETLSSDVDDYEIIARELARVAPALARADDLAGHTEASRFRVAALAVLDSHDRDNWDRRRALIGALHRLAISQSDLDDPAAAARTAEHACGLLSDITPDDDRAIEGYRMLAMNLGQLALARADLDEPDRAAAAVSRLVATREFLIVQEPIPGRARRQLAGELYRIGRRSLETDHFDLAIDCLDHALRTLDPLLADDETDPRDLRAVTMCRSELALALWAAAELDPVESNALRERAAQTAREALPAIDELAPQSTRNDLEKYREELTQLLTDYSVPTGR